MNSNGGFYAMYRGWLDHEAWAGEPFDKRSAFCWLIENARFRSGDVTVAGQHVALDRGQLAVSIRHLARTWQWDTKTVQRFLRVLTSRKMVTTATPTGITVITISNYERFQNVATATPTPTPTGSPTPTPTNKNNEDNKVPNGPMAKEDLFGTEAAPPKAATPQSIIYGQCREFLVNHGGLKDRNARALLGKWVKDSSPGIVIEVVSEAMNRGVPEPVGWITKAIQARSLQRNTSGAFSL